MSPQRRHRSRRCRRSPGRWSRIALVLSAVFVPIAFIPGITGRLYQQFASPSPISVIISAFNALTLSPGAVGDAAKPPGDAPGSAWPASAPFNKCFDRMTGELRQGRTEDCVRKVLLHAGRCSPGRRCWLDWLGSRIPTGFVLEEDQGYASAMFQLPDAASLAADARGACKQVEEVLAKHAGRSADYTVVAGYSLLTQHRRELHGTVFFVPSTTVGRAQGRPRVRFEAILRSLNVAVLQASRRARIFAFLPPRDPGIGTAGGVS